MIDTTVGRFGVGLKGLRQETVAVFRWRYANRTRAAMELGASYVRHDLLVRGSRLRREVAGLLRSEMNYLRRLDSRT